MVPSYIFLVNRWFRQPGMSRSFAPQLEPGQARPFTLPGPAIPGLEFEQLVDYTGPSYSAYISIDDYSDDIALQGVKRLWDFYDRQSSKCLG